MNGPTQCLPWQNHSCCTHETTKELHQGNMYNFNWNHCNQPMGDACRRHFVQDLCFYECSPNIGPWLVGVDMKIRKEKPLDMPLCQSECDHWWDDCKSELTCLDNWGKGFNWTGATNTCPMGKPCFSFAHMFRDAQTFCENVWDHSWKVVDDSKPCMKLLFAPSEGNPNNDVAQWKVNQMIANVAPAAPSSVRIAQFLVFCTLSFLL
ncbi:PREDICTED: folate receptor alpha-like isoform X2 [Priapulus caudatus]|uniref:Folate receptor alpha-like isoform X2 n=1 Tax=Priapulus caudatus TaxID=37621 RepID=A0ABM1EFS7_PRICU|nr:PREDICTED: folate receptor alpha-like isoform X2 [Priapulus caudatus]